ncbi:MAG: bifunctional tetrahydrofolate synthase/dihydrofolate synthase [Gammaproteobacteria bacterium]|nr:bifunctional tetrahydrofolate synthase/dihydrofolate synthase [Gammaproteobacteria bacterium]
MRFKTLQQWLDWQESLNPKEIDLGLDRVSKVLENLKLSADFSSPVITVAGTNGKGSTVAFLESILLAAGCKVGCYTSPHLLKYNERIRINGQLVDDLSLCRAFEQVDQARENIALTYFEFGTLAALLLFSQVGLDAVVLEVGLGGRLDAVNVINADASIVTTVDIDHIDWLGDDREKIGYEKAGIFRAHRPAIFGALQIPDSVRNYASQIQAQLFVAGRDYLYQGVGADRWQWSGPESRYSDLAMPSLSGAYQLQNAAAVIMALEKISFNCVIDERVISEGLQSARLMGRYQRVHSSPQVIVDVAHNPQAARALVEQLADDPVEGRTRVVLSMLADKAVDEVVQILSPVVDDWYLAGLSGARGLDVGSIAKIVKQILPDVKLCNQQTVSAACKSALDESAEEDRILVLGSFYTVTEAINYFNKA